MTFTTLRRSWIRRDPLIGWAGDPAAGGALYAWDFQANQARFNGKYVGPVASTPGLVIGGAGARQAQDLAGNWQSFASGALRRTNRGGLFEPARTQYAANPSAPANQTTGSLPTGTYILWIEGAGSVAVAAGSATGSGFGSAVAGTPVVFTVSVAGTVTLTVTGSPTWMQLENGGFKSSRIAAVGARVDDVLSLPVSGIDYPLSLFVEFERMVDTGAIERVFGVDGGSSTTTFAAAFTSADLIGGYVQTGAGVQASVTVGAAVALNVATKLATRAATNDVQAARAGALGTADTSAAMPSTPTTIRFGSRNASLDPFFGYVRKAAIWTRALTDAQLQAVST